MPDGGLKPRKIAQRLIRDLALTLERQILETPSGCVAFVRRRGAPMVLKVPRPDDDEANGAVVLRHYDGHGAVRVLDVMDGGMLLERLAPGEPLRALVRAGRDDAATAVICDVAAALHRSGPPTDGHPRIEDWGRGFGRYRRLRDRTVAGPLVDRAEAVFRDLAASQGGRRLLHGDLQHYNILRDEERGWVAIDPKGVLGEAAYEMGAALRNAMGGRGRCADPGTVDRRGGIRAERLALERARILGWAYAQAVLSAIWSVEAGDDPVVDLALADYCLTV